MSTFSAGQNKGTKSSTYTAGQNKGTKNKNYNNYWLFCYAA